ncbi:hypothetical protein BC833DRAFT_594678 [Globomyces pollinis-pini]|nr:hypothetical protein BC833DRAFT_594678 [Globomyces pollinis-pini]
MSNQYSIAYSSSDCATGTATGIVYAPGSSALCAISPNKCVGASAGSSMVVCSPDDFNAISNKAFGKDYAVIYGYANSTCSGSPQTYIAGLIVNKCITSGFTYSESDQMLTRCGSTPKSYKADQCTSTETGYVKVSIFRVGGTSTTVDTKGPSPTSVSPASTTSPGSTNGNINVGYPAASTLLQLFLVMFV